MTRYLRLLSLASGVAMLAACAGSPPARYYTLLPAADTTVASAGTAGFALEIMPVSVPLQVDQPQIMLRTTDDSLSPIYSQRWAAPLGEEMQTALSHAMTAALGAPDVSALGTSAGMPVWRVQVDVQRFDMLLGGPALIDATWRIRQSGEGRDKPAAHAVLLCRSLVQVPAQGDDLPALVQAQQRAVAALAQTVSSAIRQGGSVPASSETVRVNGCSRTTDAS